MSNILKSQGVGGLYVGFLATLVRDVPYTVLELGLYENIKLWWLQSTRGSPSQQAQRNQELVLPRGILHAAAAFTGAVAAFLTTPLDLVKTKLMVRHQK